MGFLFKIQNSFSVLTTVSRKVIDSYAVWKKYQEVPSATTCSKQHH